MKVPGAFVGAVAVILHGHTRTTTDIDIQVFSPASSKAFARSLAAHGFSPREAPSMDAEARFADITHFMRLFHDLTGIWVDVMIGRFEFHRELVERRVSMQWGDRVVPVASLNYLLVMKLIAGRTHDLDDARRLIALHPTEIDLPWVMHYVQDMSMKLEVPERVEPARQILGL